MALKLGCVVMVGWLIYVVYSIQQVDAWNDDYRAAIAIFITFAGLVFFPTYFILVCLFGKVRRRQQR